ncbi:nucleotide-diphospho-sugar transferase [Kickxella alabastrina]|uniref:nucleotide-diphospho-sugar transferase n=1 Tax=Kickxella alabastrina TaxID=61397 RepID=UPI00221F864F|nr:nucleotide-diphospho-sugar transferase [Kickxella alabastrina]KAI7827224.1 nucleotide-diphospho-sugar transferase [Kickxella alabastrina]
MTANGPMPGQQTAPATGEGIREWFSWKVNNVGIKPQLPENQQIPVDVLAKIIYDAANGHNVGDSLKPLPEEEELGQGGSKPYEGLVKLVRLGGWPTEFPENLDEYQESVLQNKTWASETEKHRAEIAPWVWHHRGEADVLDELAKSADQQVAFDAMVEMARLGIIPSPGNENRRANAAFVVLLRNRELDDFLATMRQLEDRFNHKYHYPYIFLNDEPFSKEFMQLVAISTTSNVTFSMIPRDHWSLPDFVDPIKAAKAREQMAADNIIYGGSLSYRHMCRFNSGFFYKHPLLQSVDWYWRVEPGVDFYCDIDYDPFVYMQNSGKLYSFVIALKELKSTIPTLWQHTLEYMLNTNASSDLMSYFVSETGDYNLCHFWSNFEIASLNWLRSDAYDSYFRYLDQAKGFFMERWGDAPVHSIAAGMLLNRDQVHFFDDIGYRHEDFMHCPDTKENLGMKLKCQCPQRKNFDTSIGSCLPRWKSYSPAEWTPRDTAEALRLMEEKNLVTDVTEPHIVAERRQWYNVFAGF